MIIIQNIIVIYNNNIFMIIIMIQNIFIVIGRAPWWRCTFGEGNGESGAAEGEIKIKSWPIKKIKKLKIKNQNKLKNGAKCYWGDHYKVRSG